MTSCTIKLAALLGLLASVSGCAKPPTVVPEDGWRGAEKVATAVSGSFLGVTPMESTRLLLPRAPGPDALTASSVPRANRVGSLTGDDSFFIYEIEAFDTAGNPVPWESSQWEIIDRVRVIWRFHLDWADSAGPSYMRLGSSGEYDVRGVQQAAPEYVFSGASRDTSDYRMVIPDVDIEGRCTWLAGSQAVRWSKAWDRPYPLGGRQHYDVDLEWIVRSNQGDQRDHVKASVVIEYDGTRFATMTVDGQYRFRLDLETGTVVREAV